MKAKQNKIEKLFNEWSKRNSYLTKKFGWKKPLITFVLTIFAWSFIDVIFSRFTNVNNLYIKWGRFFH